MAGLFSAILFSQIGYSVQIVGKSIVLPLATVVFGLKVTTRANQCHFLSPDKLAEAPKWGRADNLSPRNMEIFSKPSLRLIGDELESISHKVSFMSTFENGVKLGTLSLSDQVRQTRWMGQGYGEKYLFDILTHPNLFTISLAATRT